MQIAFSLLFLEGSRIDFDEHAVFETLEYSCKFILDISTFPKGHDQHLLILLVIIIDNHLSIREIEIKVMHQSLGPGRSNKKLFKFSHILHLNYSTHIANSGSQKIFLNAGTVPTLFVLTREHCEIWIANDA